MFGYVRYDIAELRVKDLMLYKALYCGLCKGIAKSCGQMARIGLSYDMTFLSALLHNMTGTDVSIEQQNCFEHAIKKRPIAKVDPLTRELGALNTVLFYFKLNDDVRDKERGKGRMLWFKKGYSRAKKEYPQLLEIVKSYMTEQAEAEKGEYTSCDIAADPTARMMVNLSRHFLKEQASESSDELFYALGKWVYLIDALDDYDKDKKRGSFNPFVREYGAESKHKLLEDNKEEVSFLFDSMFYAMREGLSGVKFHFNRDLTDNVILRGLPLETKRVFEGGVPQKMTIKI